MDFVLTLERAEFESPGTAEWVKMTHTCFFYYKFYRLVCIEKRLIKYFAITMQYISIKTFLTKKTSLYKFAGGLLLSLSAYGAPTLAKCYFLDVQGSHNPHSYYYHSLFRYLKNNLLINLFTPQLLAQQSATANKNLLRICQCKSKLTVYLQPEGYKNK